MKIAIGSDHAGYELKEEIKSLLMSEGGIEVLDMGSFDDSPVDYPDFGSKVARSVGSHEADRGILVCGSGIGMSIVANKFNGIRAALCNDVNSARLSRQHNDANILVLGSRVSRSDSVKDIAITWLNTEFEGGRHEKRLSKIHKIEGSDEGIS